MIIDCNVLCFREGNENLGLKDEDILLPCSIDLTEVIAIKQNGGASEENFNYAVIYFHRDYFVIDLEYTEAVKLWKEAKIKQHE